MPSDHIVNRCQDLLQRFVRISTIRIDAQGFQEQSWINGTRVMMMKHIMSGRENVFFGRTKIQTFYINQTTVFMTYLVIIFQCTKRNLRGYAWNRCDCL
jgi:hypothetical protein